MDAANKPSIPQVLDGENLLITGGTGFVGKVLLEKILRCCPGVDRIYLIVRSKKGQEIEKRIEELLGGELFDRCRAERGDIQWCCGSAAKDTPRKNGRKGPVVVGIAGDMYEAGLGLSDEDRSELESHVSVVFHSAATVKFNDPLRQATLLNVRGTRDMLKLAIKMSNLKAFLHVSTVYAHVSNHEGVMEERLYGVPMEPEDVIKAAEELDDEEFEKVIRKLAAIYQNTYLCTKALSERIVGKHYKHMPIAIYRPGIVGAIHRDPIPGWSEGYRGPSIPVLAATSGLVSTLHCGKDLKPEILPVDHVANAMLAVAWKILINHSGENNRTNSGKSIPVYNHVSSRHCNFTWEMFRMYANKIFVGPNEKRCFYHVYLTGSPMIYEVNFQARLLFAKVADSFSRYQGKESNMADLLQKVKSGLDTLRYFMNNEFKFSDSGLINLHKVYSKVDSEHRGGGEQEGCSFDFDISKLNWKDYIHLYMTQLRVMMNSQDPQKLEASLKRSHTFRMLERSLLVAGTGLSFAMVYLLSIASRWLYMRNNELKGGKA